MSYTINIETFQTNPSRGKFSVVEQTVFRDGTWSECNKEILQMNESGTSGMLRFMNGQGESFLLAFGVHNYKRWCDIVVDITPSDTGVQIHPTYYRDGNGSRNEMLWKQLAKIEKVSSRGTRVHIEYLVAEGKDLRARVIIS